MTLRTKSITESDVYKFSMAEAGAALRIETFYYSHRRGGVNGWHYMPVDVDKYVRSCLPSPTNEDYDFLRSHRYDVGAAFREAFKSYDHLQVVGVPKGSWFYNREPAFSVSGHSAVGSWLEPHTISLHFRVQVATLVVVDQPVAGRPLDERFKFATCEAERDIIREVFDSLGKPCPDIEVRSDEYYRDVLARAQKLVNIVHNPDRIFEVGMRATSCLEQHEIALRAIKEAGIKRTSNGYLAQKLDMIPVGTMGHEHAQRCGDDYEAFVTMRDRFPGFLFYLPDTFNTLRSGIPSALRVIAESPERDAGIRFDSEHSIRGHYTFTIARAREMGIEPRLALESGWNDKLTEEFEHLRKMAEWPEDRQAYGYGGYLVKPEWPSFLRDDVSAVYKLSQTGCNARMKFGDEPGSAKASIPGVPVIWRPSPMEMGPGTPAGYIAQSGEDWKPPVPAAVLTGAYSGYSGLSPVRAKSRPLEMSPATLQLIAACEKQRDEAIARAALRGL